MTIETNFKNEFNNKKLNNDEKIMIVDCELKQYVKFD